MLSTAGTKCLDFGDEEIEKFEVYGGFIDEHRFSKQRTNQYISVVF